MKILITSDWYLPAVNGVVASVLNLERELRAMGHKVKVLTLAQSNHSHKDGDTYYVGSLNASMLYPYARISVHMCARYLDEIVAWQPDIIHSQCEFTTFQFARKVASRLQIPIVHTYHTIYEDYTHYFAPTKNLGRKAASAFTRLILRKVDGVIAPTDKVRHLLKGYGVEEKIYTVPTGIDLERFKSSLSPEERQNRRAALGIPDDNFVLVTVGRLAKEKNIEELLEHLSLLDRSHLTYLIVGGGPAQEELEKLVHHWKLDDTVIFTGMVAPEETPAYYQLGDVFISASNSETQGLTYLEALACGLPAICKADHCLDDLVIDGQNGFQFTSCTSFETAVNALRDDANLLQRMTRAAAETAKAYSTPLFAQHVYDVYCDVLRRAWHASKEGLQYEKTETYEDASEIDHAG